MIRGRDPEPGTPPISSLVHLDRSQENFPVALRCLRAPTRNQLWALYRFARLCDEVGDSIEPSQRSSVIEELDSAIDDAFSGRRTDPVVAQAAEVAAANGIDRALFHDLVAANRMDQVRVDYETVSDLEAYCVLSAHPIGRMVLQLFTAPTPDQLAWSDGVCRALQVIEHCQDVGEDARAGRIYLPRVERERFGVAPDDLLLASTSPGLKALLRFQAHRARSWLSSGRALVRTLKGEGRLAVSGYVGGGYSALAELERADYDVLGGSVTRSKIRIGVWMGRIWVGSLRPADRVRQ
jgi:squalene synthase HpnC